MKHPAKVYKPLVSVVMPSLDQCHFLEIAIRSVLEQNYRNIELIVADGGSIDGSTDLLARLQIEYAPRIRWFSYQDGGAAEAINRAISFASGEIVGWLNSDDMYLQGAVNNAVSYLSAFVKHKMVYGYGSHINLGGQFLSHYPTKPPSTEIGSFSNGSFICQPTVFFRREALKEIGSLDESLKLAFDFDLFIRFFKRFPRQVGMIREIQAYSRLHPSCMTMRLRREVALEGMHVVFKELDLVPEHWFWTYIDELCINYPFTVETLPLARQVESFLKDSKKFFKDDVLNQIIRQLNSDWRIRLSTLNLFATVQADGWVSKRLQIKYRWDSKLAKSVLVHCSANWPKSGKIRLKTYLPSGLIHAHVIDVPGDFTLRLEIPRDAQSSGSIIWTIETSQFFVPSIYDGKSNDRRRLSFQVLRLSLEE